MRVFRALPLVCLLSTLTLAAVPDRVTRAIDASQMIELARSVHPKAQAQYDQGVVGPEFRLGYVTLLLSPSPSQQRAIDQLLAEQQDPASPNYHKWLTPEQYADRFGLSQNDISRITAWLQGQGFKVLSVPRGRNSIIVSGTAFQFEDAFQTEIHHYNVNGELHYANATPLRVPGALSGIVTGVRGLNDFRMKAMNARKRVHPEYYDSSLQFTFLAPGDIKTLYDIAPLYTAGIDGTGQKLAVVGQTDIYLADINNFRSGFGLSQINGCANNANNVVTACNTTNFRYVLVGTETGTPSKCGDLAEADLDIEWSGATARNAQIIYVNSPLVWNSGCTTPTNSNGGVEAALADAINNNYAPVISMSYGICEAQAADHEAELQQANLQGITVLNSSGDTSAAGCDNFTNNTTPPNLATGGLAVSYPASSPEVTAVGGTAVPFADIGSPYWGTTNGTDGGSLVPPPPQLPEQSWNDPAEFGEYCAGPGAGGTFCTHYHITSALTAQEALGLGGGGGGASNCYTETLAGVCQAGFPQPAWQQGLAVAGAPAAVRYVPDISLLASPNFTGYIYCTPLSELGGTGSTSSCAPGGPAGIANALAGCATSGGTCSVVGGTSASTPVFAGMVVLLNQYFQGTSAAGLGNINPMLYKLAKVPGNTAFYQLTSASSSNNNVVYCAGGTPSIQPAALRCPGVTGTVGTIGYQASNFDASTGYNLVTGLGSVDLNGLALLWSANRTASTTALTAAPTSAFVGNTVKLTATVTPASATGTVSFFDNGSSTALGTVSLDGTTGIAVFNWTPTASQLGSNSITASYGGDGANGTSTSSAVVVTVSAPTFNFTANSPTSHTVLAGQKTLNYSFTATPTSSATFEGNVTLSCSAFTPTDPTLTASSCAFSPSSTIAAGSGATTVTMTIQTAGPNTGTGAAIQQRADKRAPWLPVTLPIAGVVMAGWAGRKRAKRLALAGLCVSLMLFGVLIACGGGSNPVSVTVSPTSASLYPNNTGWPSQTANFSANVTNTSNTAVSWTATSGTIDASGNYTAPTVAAGLPSSVTINATSLADSSKTGTATVTLKPATLPKTYSVTVTATEGPTSHSQNVSLVVQ
jgi:hypothetical protein